MIVKEIIMTKDFRSHSAKFLRQNKILHDHGGQSRCRRYLGRMGKTAAWRDKFKTS
jgi:hypothetical protein